MDTFLFIAGALLLIFFIATGYCRQREKYMKSWRSRHRISRSSDL